jgi:hypothetical protein
MLLAMISSFPPDSSSIIGEDDDVVVDVIYKSMHDDVPVARTMTAAIELAHDGGGGWSSTSSWCTDGWRQAKRDEPEPRESDLGV